MSENIFDVFLTKKFIGPIIIILAAIIIYKFIFYLLSKAKIIGKTEIEKKRRHTILILVSNIIKYVIVVFAIILILDIYGINTSSIIAGLGVVGVVIGLAFQDALKDIINGINIIMDNYYVVGDYIKYNNFEGTVISFGLKTTKIKSDSGEVLTVANRNISSVVNLSQKQSILYFNISTDPAISEKIVKDIINTILKELFLYTYVDVKESKYLGIEQIKSASTTYLFQVKCSQNNAKALTREINKKIKEILTKNKIEYKD